MLEFNVDWKAECGQLNPAYVTKNNFKKKKQKTNASAQNVRFKSKICECSRKTTELQN